MSRPLRIVESAALVGRSRYVELTLFRLLGERARSSAHARLAGFFSGASLAHAWRARQLEEHLLVSIGLPGPTELTTSPGPHFEGALALLGRSTASASAEGASPAAVAGADDLELLDALRGALYPAMLEGYRARLAATCPASDPPLTRTMARLVDDLQRLLAEANALSPVGSESDLARRVTSALGDGSLFEVA